MEIRSFRLMDSSEKTVKILSNIIMGFALFVTLFPLLNLFSNSISGLKYVAADKIIIIPRDVSFSAYTYVLGASRFWLAIKNTLFVTALGTSLSLFTTLLCGYALSKVHLPGRRWIMLYFVFSMLFSGGMIPHYLLVKSLNLLNNIWVLIVPGCFSCYNMLLIKNYFEGLPQELSESAQIDGANQIKAFWFILLPLAFPVLVTIALFSIVGYWNVYFNALIYITRQDLVVMQTYLAGIIFESQDPTGSFALSTDNASGLAKESVVNATIICTMLPVCILYPFLQKYFVSGIVLGSVKG